MPSPKKKTNKLKAFQKRFSKSSKKLKDFISTPRYQGLALLVLGTFLISFSLGWKVYSKGILSFSRTPIEAKNVENKIIPTRITIPSLKIDIPVETTTIRDGLWQISEDKASFLDISAGLKASGNTVIYGHNKRKIFGSLPYVKKGETIEIQDQNGNKYKYIVSEKLTVNPDQIDLVEPKDKETLTIYTCTGLFDSKRFVIVAYPAS